jgi:tRNA threonylcarbamoyladenosine biosynthesis protein TsaB
MILTIKTDQPLAEIGLYDGSDQTGYKSWEAHRELSSTIHVVIKDLLDAAGKDWSDINGIVYFKGPGSFTGLRIGASVANALAAANSASVSNKNGEDWIDEGIAAVQSGKNEPAVPEYGSAPHITVQKK